MIALAFAAVVVGIIVALRIDDAERERRHAERMPAEPRFRVVEWGLEDDVSWRWPS